MTTAESRAGQQAIREARRAKLAERLEPTIYPRRHGVLQYVRTSASVGLAEPAYVDRLIRWANKPGPL